MPGGFGDDAAEGGRYQYQGSVNPADPSVANGQITPEQWHQYQMQRRRAALMGILGTLGGATALGAAGSALGGAGGSAAGALPPVSGGAPWAVTPYAGAASMAPTGAATVGGSIGAGAGLTGGGGAGLLGGMSAKDILALSLAGASTVGGAMSGRNENMSPNTGTNDPQMKELMDLMLGRVRKSEPLHDSILAMANGLLPTQYQKGGGGMP